MAVRRGIALTVAIGDLRPNPWNPNKMDDAMYRKELASIRKFGFVDPVTVREVRGGYEIVDGEHRWRAAKELGFKELPIFSIGEISDAEAKQLTIVLNETRGRSEPKKLGAVLRDLLEDTPKADLLDLLPFSPPVFDRLVGDLEEWDAPAALPGNGWVERTYRLPKDAAEVLDEALAKFKATNGEDIPDWQVLELLAADYIGTP